MHPIIQEDLENIVVAIKSEAGALEGKTLLISGGAGFLGSYFLGTLDLLNRSVFKKPCTVVSLDNYITASRKGFIQEIQGPNVRLIEGDVTAPINIDGPVDYIIHAAGLASPFYYKKYPLETIEAAIAGAKNLLRLALEKHAKSFLLFSSSEIYGDPDPNFIPTPESYKGSVSCIGPRACYDESKRLAETIGTTYFEIHGVPIKIVRPFNVYGPGMKSDDYRVIPAFITKAIRGESLNVHGSGNQTRTFCYVSDAITGFLKVLLSEKNGEAYNVGTAGPEVNMVTLANMITGFFENKMRIELISYPESYPADEPNRRCPDLTKIRSRLGYEPKIDLKTGLERTIRWFRDTLPPSTNLV